MKDDERQQWLDGLKPGDLVAYRDGFGNMRISAVQKRTPGGMIVVDGLTWRRDGWTSDSGYFTRGVLEVTTEEIKKEQKRAVIIGYLRRVKWNECSLETLEKVKQIMDGESND